MSEGKNVIEVKNLRAVVHEEGQDITLLHNSSFVVREGECLGILGESGSGKSTTGRVLAGLLKPDSGVVLIEGEDVYAGSKGANISEIVSPSSFKTIQRVRIHASPSVRSSVRASLSVRER